MEALQLWFRESPFSTMGVIDIIDIALLTWIIYRLLMIIRGTRGQQSLLGLAILGGVYLVSKLAGMQTMSWVLDNILVYIVLALLILFQEDIRRALARAGGSVSLGGRVGTDASQLEEVVKAVFALAKRKIGALIAIERQAALAPFAEGAPRIGADVSADLLQSIFHPTSPIHDGAVVISDNQIYAAGVFVPISLSKDISKTYGTRHRAAIGLSEQTDAICLVVSEERGTVAIVKNGTITPVADANDLRQLLTEKLEEIDDPASTNAQMSGVHSGP